MIKPKIAFLIIISVIVFFTRFYKLVSYPPHLTIDEVAIGYNAFSILRTGKDEWGTTFPISFRSVGDYKAPILIYLTVPFIKVFGLTELAVRLPVAIFSALSVFLFWILVSKYIFNKKYTLLPYLATTIFSISPWLISFSRSGFEAVLAFTFMMANVIFIFKLRKTGRLIDFFFMFLFAYLSAIAYHSTKIVVPLLNIFLVLLNYKYFTSCVVGWYSKNKYLLFLTTLLFIGITVFFLDNFIFGSGSSRASMTFLTKDFDYAKALMPTFLSHPFSAITSLAGLLSFWFKRYLEYFSSNFYLSSGLGLATPGYPGQGVIYAIEYPFLIIGFLILIVIQKYLDNIFSNKFVTQTLIAWFFIAFIPASITNNSQHALRTLNIVPIISILIAVGISYVYANFKLKSVRFFFIAIIIGGYALGLTRFFDYYTLHYPIELSEGRSYGWKQVALFVRDHHSEYGKVYVDPRFGTDGPYTYGVPYLYFLFYSVFDPNVYVNSPVRKTGGTNFENYIFTNIDWPALSHDQNNLYVSSPWSFPKEMLSSPKKRLYVPFLNKASGLYVISDKERL